MQRKRFIVYFRILYARRTLNRYLWSIGLFFSPAASSFHAGESADLDAVLLGFENNVQRHSFQSLAAFEFRIHYDQTALNFHSSVVRIGSNDPTDTSNKMVMNIPEGVTVNASEISCIWDFSFRSPDDLSLARASFFGSGIQSDSLSFSNEILDEDQKGFFSVTWGKGVNISERSGGAMLLQGLG